MKLVVWCAFSKNAANITTDVKVLGSTALSLHITILNVLLATYLIFRLFYSYCMYWLWTASKGQINSHLQLFHIIASVIYQYTALFCSGKTDNYGWSSFLGLHTLSIWASDSGLGLVRPDAAAISAAGQLLSCVCTGQHWRTLNWSHAGTSLDWSQHFFTLWFHRC